MSGTAAGTSEPVDQKHGETVLLRRYSIAPGGWEGFLEIWRQVIPLRQRHGYEVLFALADEENDMFTWAIRHQGDEEAAAAGYYADPDRTALEHIAEYVTGFEVNPVNRVL